MLFPVLLENGSNPDVYLLDIFLLGGSCPLIACFTNYHICFVFFFCIYPSGNLGETSVLDLLVLSPRSIREAVLNLLENVAGTTWECY